MQKEYKNLYFMMTRNSLVPSNCLPLSPASQNTETISQLLGINRSICDLIDSHSQNNQHKRRKSDYQTINIEQKPDGESVNSKRIHHNFTHFASTQQTIKLPMKAKGEEDNRIRVRQAERRRDLYDDHIDKYMKSKYQSKQIIKEYLTNRQLFIREACEEIQKQIKVSGKMQKQKKHTKINKNKLPKIQEISSRMMKKTELQRGKDGSYLSDLSQLKKAEQLDSKDRRRRQLAFRRKMSQLQIRLDKQRASSLYF